MSEPLSATHNQAQCSSLPSSGMSEEQSQPQPQQQQQQQQQQQPQIISEIKIEDNDSSHVEHRSEDGDNEFLESNEQSDSTQEMPPQMMEMLISPYVRRHNMVKSTLIQALHTHHAATNVVRVARKYIYCLYGIIENITGPNHSHSALINLRDEAYDREEELRQWETLFNNTDVSQLLIDAINMPTPDSKSNGSSTNVSSIPQTLSRVTEIASKNFSKQQNGSANESKDDNFNMHPVEMLELSMQTSSQDHLEHSDDDFDEEMNNSHSQTSESQSYGAQVLQGFLHDSEFVNNIQKQHNLKSNHNQQSSQQLQQQQNDDKRQFFTCEFDGCNYSTHNRQRLNMHQKGHTGTPLFYCDIEGCGYLSNFKGNIKIHKRHKHKEGFDDDSSPSKNSRGRRRKFESAFFNDSLVHCAAPNEQLNDATLESSSNDSKKDKDEMNICRFDANSGNYICQWPSCDWITRWKQLVEPHILGHTGMKPYKCDVPGCDYQTNYKGNVKLHKKKHIKDRPHSYNLSNFGVENDQESFRCEINGCDFETVWKNSFESHQRNHYRNSSGSSNGTTNNNHHHHQSNGNSLHNSSNNNNNNNSVPSSTNNHHTSSSSSTRSGESGSNRIVVFTRPGEKNPTRLSIITKPVVWKDNQNNVNNNIEKKLSTESDREDAEPQSAGQDGPSSEYTKLSSSHSNSPEAMDDEEDDESEFIDQRYIDKSTTRPFLVNNSHY